MRIGYAGLGAAAALSLTTVHASAHTYGSEYMTSWSGCECNASALSYTDDQISYFNNRMTARGHTRKFSFGNSSVWASDLVEDRDLSGQDNLYGDTVEFFALSSHGTRTGTTQNFITPTCKGNTYKSCEFNSHDARLGERSGYWSSPASGNLRFMMLLTCYSVDSRPNEQWGAAMQFGTDTVMGYRGLSADSFATDEVAGDFVDAAYGDGDTIKAAWFWAIEDSFWVDDTGALVMSGTSESNAKSRRDSLKVSSARRPSTEQHFWFAWSWHEG